MSENAFGGVVLCVCRCARDLRPCPKRRPTNTIKRPTNTINIIKDESRPRKYTNNTTKRPTNTIKRDLLVGQPATGYLMNLEERARERERERIAGYTSHFASFTGLHTCSEQQAEVTVGETQREREGLEKAFGFRV